MRRVEKTLERIYERDAATGEFIISIGIDKYPDVFNELDSAPWRRRDLDYDLRVFLEESSSDIPLKYDIILQFSVSQETQDTIKEERIKLGLRTYFAFIRNSVQREIRTSYERSGLYVLASFLLLFTSYSLQVQITGNAVFTTLVDGVSIGGWVFLWEAISTLAFRNRGARTKYLQYKRLSTAPIQFRYSATDSTAV
ncbi:MAG: hypothetical protein NWF05_05590 [Candidatus Bathyarchaeota archaeon]|nr:hypothetical protein [Candidatus Bathyarchaeota archaeon]